MRATCLIERLGLKQAEQRAQEHQHDPVARAFERASEQRARVAPRRDPDA
jgi:hypothetical protein